MKIDGDLSEFKDAFCTPVEYFNTNNLEETAPHSSSSCGMTTRSTPPCALDTKPANLASDDRLWGGGRRRMVF